ncbi:threonine--tRNA ligase [Malacoplasma muris]|uniref:threonine--tRNA ligase n=1 Tax=Malacoplasma muris TaxID=2119 RepID=UPI00398F49F0
MNINKQINNACAQVLLKAIKKIDSNALIYTSFINENGFYADFLFPNKLSSNDFKIIEKEMKKIIASGNKIEIIPQFKSGLNKYQKYLLNHDKNIQYIKIGDDFKNIINDEIASNVNKIKFFELTNIGGIYWQNNVKKEQLIRIYGVAFDQKEDYEEWKIFLQNQKESDHRKIGQEMEIFTFDNSVGQGLPIWLPNGETIKNQIKNFLFKIFNQEHFFFLDTPVLGSKKLYEISGHWDHYKENNFPPIVIDNETFILRPMTCPHHMMVYKQKPHSYRELPIYYCENSKLHRYESSGGLIGLERVRYMELFDCHIICKADQIEEVVKKLDGILRTVHEKLQIKIDQVDLSLHDKNDKEKYHDDPKMWEKAESQLRNILKQLKYNAVEMEGEAAFYGPKIDYQAKSNLGKMITISTIQLDFLLPKKFELEYLDENLKKQRPVLIHFGVIGTYERFIATILSQTKGILPFWLFPVQVALIPINNEYHLEYAEIVYKKLKDYGLRVKLDDSNERLSKKIRDAQISKIPYQIIIGDSERDNKNISFRKYGENESTTKTIDEFLKMLKL